jgi:hypothetical protein
LVNTSTTGISSASIKNSENITTKTSTLSAETRRRLEALSNQFDEQLSKGGSNVPYLRISSGETKTLLFDPDQIREKKISYPSDPDNPVNRTWCMVKEAGADGKIPNDAELQEWTTSVTAGRDILRWVLKGFTLLDVNRVGSGMRDIKYMISPHL